MSRFHVNVKNDKENKEDVIEYLRIVGMLEWMKMDLNREFCEVDNERQHLYEKRDYESQLTEPAAYYKGKLLKTLKSSIVVGIVFWIVWVFLILPYLFRNIPMLDRVDEVTSSDGSLYTFLFIIFYILPFIAAVVFWLLRSKTFKHFRLHIKNFIAFNAQEKQRLKNAPNQDAELDNRGSALINLFNRTEYLLEEAYSLNILHPKYRNLNAVFTMFDYFQAGSVDTLKEAINKFDNESRLDKIIDRLGDINETMRRIYDEMQYQTQLLERNHALSRQQLEYTRITAENTKKIARNTQITALNTSLLLLIEDSREWRRGY
ncbi:MAG: hypothetical protein FWG94_08140 [Oscillospiraceae bacterium]|nr:hypothetical protein [Oscillospiraceae bacterium]